MSRKESITKFVERVRRATGFDIELIPAGEVLDLQGPHRVLCRRQSTLVIRVQDPDHVREGDGDGGHTFEPVDQHDHFRVVTLDT